MNIIKRFGTAAPASTKSYGSGSKAQVNDEANISSDITASPDPDTQTSCSDGGNVLRTLMLPLADRV